MNPEEYTQERIEAYLDNIMSQSERLSFEEDLTTHSELREKFEELQQSYQLLGLMRRNQLQEELSQIIDKKTITLRPPVYQRQWFLIAASFLVLFASVYIYAFLKHSNQAIYHKAFAQYNLSTGVRGSEADQQFTQFQKALDQYSHQEYDSAITNFIKVPVEDPHFSLSHFYLGNAYLVIKKPQLAIEALTSATDLDDMDHIRDWYLALAYLADNYPEKSWPILKDLETNSPDSLYQRKATEVMNELEHPLRVLPLIG
ncbi:MAG: hypothetical protein R3B93_02480 [Bacteroidia bacterium]